MSVRIPVPPCGECLRFVQHSDIRLGVSSEPVSKVYGSPGENPCLAAGREPVSRVLGVVPPRIELGSSV